MILRLLGLRVFPAVVGPEPEFGGLFDVALEDLGVETGEFTGGELFGVVTEFHEGGGVVATTFFLNPYVEDSEVEEGGYLLGPREDGGLLVEEGEPEVGVVFGGSLVTNEGDECRIALVASCDDAPQYLFFVDGTTPKVRADGVHYFVHRFVVERFVEGEEDALVRHPEGEGDEPFPVAEVAVDGHDASTRGEVFVEHLRVGVNEPLFDIFFRYVPEFDGLHGDVTEVTVESLFDGFELFGALLGEGAAEVFPDDGETVADEAVDDEVCHVRCCVYQPPGGVAEAP